MGPLHCPLCTGLALLSAMRFTAHAVLLWRRYRPAGLLLEQAPRPQPRVCGRAQGLAA